MSLKVALLVGDEARTCTRMYLTPKPILFPQSLSKHHGHAGRILPISCNCGFVLVLFLHEQHTRTHSFLCFCSLCQSLSLGWDMTSASTLLWALALALLLSMQSSGGTLCSSILALSMSYCMYGLSPGPTCECLEMKGLSQGHLAQHLAHIGLANSADLNQINSGRFQAWAALVVQITCTSGGGTGFILERAWKWPANRRHLCLSTFQAL